MKSLFNVSILILAGSLFIASCMKETGLRDANSLSQTVSNDATTPDLSKCKIRRIYQLYFPETRATALFTYNAAGNPYSVVYSNGGTGVHDHYFFYDAKNRLKEYRLTWGFYIDEFHYFRYNDKNQILIDSAIYSDANGSYPLVNVSTLEYDSLGRVVKETIVNIKNGNEPLRPTRRPTFTYDSRGNLAVGGWKSSSYDYKINPLRQNAIFQFIMRNYSMNNAAPQAKYNSMGLPLSMNPTNDAFFNMLTTEQVVYDCQ
jgi:hypothetical protein